jgi:uncharacterized protein YqeY
MGEPALSEARLRQDLQEAMKRRAMETVYVLRGLLAVVANRRIDVGGELPAAEIVNLVVRESKKREEAEEFARKAGREDLVTQNAAERAVLARYLPTMLAREELTALVTSWMAEGVTTMGPLMARLKERYAGQYDGKVASEIVRSLVASA